MRVLTLPPDAPLSACDDYSSPEADGLDTDELDANDISSDDSIVDDATDIVSRLPRSWPVDGQASCNAFFDCTLPPTETSRYCRFHAERLRSFCNSAATLHPLRPGSKEHGELLWIRNIARAAPARTWVIDFEFTNLTTNMSAIPWSLAIRDFDGRLLVSSLIDYDEATADELLELA